MYAITIENAAFEDDLAHIEVARILKRLANDIENMGLCEYVLRDINGNRVGNAQEVSQISPFS